MPSKILSLCEQVLDDRAEYFILLANFIKYHSFEELPRKHRENLRMLEIESNWRENGYVLRRLEKASDKMRKNEKRKISFGNGKTV